jgi:hypothetical protein
MKKRLVTLSLVGFMATTLVSCSPVTLKNDADGNAIIVTLNNGKNTVTYTANELFGDYLSTSTGIEAYYQAIYDVLIRNKYDGNITSEMTTSIDAKIDSFVNTVKSTASSNGTSYNTALSDALEDAGVDDLGELREVYTLEVEKETYSDTYYDENMAATSSTNNTSWSYNRDNLTWEYVQEKAPYHIRHILVKTDDVDGTSLYNKQISKSESEKLYSVISRLASGESFGDVAYDASEDTNSPALYGSLGIMDLDNSFVAEFDDNIYYYDAILNDNYSPYTTAEKMAKLGIPTTITSGATVINTVDILNSTLNAISYSDVYNLKKYADITSNNMVDISAKSFTDSNGVQHTIDDNTLPRNVLFNSKFNNHGLSFITNEGISDEDTTDSVWATPSETIKTTLGLSDETKILTDTDGNPILVAYNPSTGIHFMIIEKSPLYQKYSSYYDWSSGETVSLVDSSKSDEENFTSEENLEKEMMHYYSQDVPSATTTITNSNSYVTYLKAIRSTYQTRADAIKSNVQGFDENMSYRLFESLIYEVESGTTSVIKEDEDGNKTLRTDVTIDSEMLNKILSYIDAKRSNTEYTANVSNVTAWMNYVNLLSLQVEQKAAKGYNLSDVITLYNI